MIELKDFFELSEKFLETSSLKSLFSESPYPWEWVKNLKNFLEDLIHLEKEFLLSPKIPVKEMVKESVLLLEGGEVIPLKEIELTEEGPVFQGERIKGAIIHSGAFFENREIVIKEGVIVESGSFIKGPAYLDKESSVRHGAYLRGSVFLGEKATAGHTTEIKNSIFFPQATAAHFAYVGDSILGQKVNLGAGTKLANLKLTRKEVVIKLGGNTLISTGMRKLGAILGDNVQTGCNSVLQPGTLIGKNSFVYPCTAPKAAFYPPSSILK